MSTYIQWSLYGKDGNGDSVSEEKAEELRDLLDDEVTEWHDVGPDDECIGQFLTTYNNGYSSITEVVGDFAKAIPNCVFQLFCHNEDEDWYQQIHFLGADRETMDGRIVYDTPQRIFYDTPELQKEV